MTYRELEIAYQQQPIVFTGALFALYSHGATVLSDPKRAENICPSGNIITPEFQVEMLGLARKMASTPYNDLMAFVKNKVPFHASGSADTDEEGICPVCGSEVEYRRKSKIDGGGICPWTCPDCGASGEEGYNSVFDRHYNVRSSDGKPIPEREQPSGASATNHVSNAPSQPVVESNQSLCPKCLNRITEREGVPMLSCTEEFTGVTEIEDDGEVVLACDDFKPRAKEEVRPEA